MRTFSSLLFVAVIATLTFATPAVAWPITSVVAYGDSLSDNGNLFALVGFPPAPYFNGRRSDGPVAVEYVAGRLGVPLLDFAVLGATTGIGNFGDFGTATSAGAISLPGMQPAFASSLPLLAPHLAQGLFIVWGGPNDFLSPSPLDGGNPLVTATRAVGNLLGMVTTLQGLGAKNILVPGMPDLGLTPYFQSLGVPAAAQASALTDFFNTTLLTSLPAGVRYYDTASLLRAVVANPSAYGFTNATSPCFDGTTVCSNPAEYVFFDDFHPTTATHELVAGGFVAAAVPEPSAFVLVAAGLVAIGGLRRSRSR